LKLIIGGNGASNAAFFHLTFDLPI